MKKLISLVLIVTATAVAAQETKEQRELRELDELIVLIRQIGEKQHGYCMAESGLSEQKCKCLSGQIPMKPLVAFTPAFWRGLSRGGAQRAVDYWVGKHVPAIGNDGKVIRLIQIIYEACLASDDETIPNYLIPIDSKQRERFFKQQNADPRW